MKQEKYEASEKKKDTHKQEVNMLIASYLSEYSIDTGKTAVVLDSETIQTTKALVSEGFPKRRIDIPNHTTAFKAIKKKHKQAYNMLLSAYLDMVAEFPESFGVAFFDYCGSFYGNKSDGIFPQKDIDKYFDNHLPSDKSLFAYTFSTRGKKHGGTMVCVNDADSHVERAARRNGYTATKLPGGYSYSGMFFNIFLIEKI